MLWYPRRHTQRKGPSATRNERRSNAVARRVDKETPTSPRQLHPRTTGPANYNNAHDAAGGAGEARTQPVAAEVGGTADLADQPRLASNDAPPTAPTATESEESDDSIAPPDKEGPSSEQNGPGDAQQILAAQEKDESHGSLLQLLPDKLGTDLLFLKSEDHHIEVHTIVGSSLVKMRFMDAVAELGDRGIQVHRSYWVATRHAKTMVRSGNRRLVRLTGGHQVPVSVTYLSDIRAAVSR